MSLVTIYDSGTAGTLLSDDFTPKTLSLNIRDAKQEDSYSENPDIVISGEDADGDDENPRSKKKKRYHRHTPLQIQELEALFKECPHPDEKQRTELSRRLNLETRQVKFWFQNRRTQMKTQLERHENAILKQENDKLRMENMAIRSALQSPVCRNCGGVAAFDQEQLLRIENANLKEELDRVGKFIARPTFVAPDSGFLMEMAVAAMDEFVKMAEMGEPLWVREFGVGREVLDFDEYRRIFPRGGGLREVGFVAEATRETGMVIVNSDVLVKTLIDATRWTDMFPGIIARAMTTDVISDGIGGTRNGLLQLMHAELQVLSPLVPVREVEFLRFCKLLQDGVWAVVDVSIDSIRENSLESGVRCRRLPSGILVQDMPNGYSKVTWVEHTEYDEMAVHELCRPLIRSGMGFGAKRWLATLQRRCECLAKILASNAARNNLAVTASGLKSMLKLAQRMMDNFCAGACTSSVQKWSKLSIGNIGKDIRMMSRQSLDNPGEPPGVVLSASTAVWLPVSPQRIFNFLRDETHRNKWDILSCGGPMQEIARIAKGEEDGNAVSLLQASSNAINAAIGTRSNGNMLILQETCTDASGCMVVYAPVDIPAMQLVMNGGDSAYVALLPSGFAILPDGQNTCGALLTVAFQILVNNLPSSKLTVESVETVNNLISCTVQKIKSALGCDA